MTKPITRRLVLIAGGALAASAAIPTADAQDAPPKFQIRITETSGRVREFAPRPPGAVSIVLRVAKTDPAPADRGADGLITVPLASKVVYAVTVDGKTWLCEGMAPIESAPRPGVARLHFQNGVPQ